MKKRSRGRPKGTPDPGYNPDALSRTGARLPPVDARFKALMDVIYRDRGHGFKAHVIEDGLRAIATPEQLKEAGLDED